MNEITEQTLRALVSKVTPGKHETMRYVHGGGRIHVDETRTLVADLYQEGDREFVAAISDGRLVLALLDRCDRLRVALNDARKWIDGTSGRMFADALDDVEEALRKDAWLAALETP
jgi:hypothetical protein